METSSDKYENNNQQQPAIQLIDVERWYCEGRNYLHVLRGASLSVMPGELVALVAQSGAGKSTLLHIAALLERPNGGDVVINSKNTPVSTSELDDKQRTILRRELIGFVYQFHHLLPEFSSLENIIIPQLIRGLDWDTAHKRACELLRYMKLSNRGHHKATELSGGERQRVAIARAVANVPDILLADEPTGNLDPQIAFHVFENMANLVRSAQISAIIATHNADLVERMDRKITLQNGEIKEFQ